MKSIFTEKSPLFQFEIACSDIWILSTTNGGGGVGGETYVVLLLFFEEKNILVGKLVIMAH